MEPFFKTKFGGFVLFQADDRLLQVPRVIVNWPWVEMVSGGILFGADCASFFGSGYV
jgi:hypothetical protein